MSTKLHDLDNGTVQTTGAATTTIITYPVADESVYHFKVKVIGFEPTTGDAVAFHYQASCKRHSAGVATLISRELIGTAHKDAALTLCNADMQVDGGNNMLVRVVGIAANTIEWEAYLEVLRYTP